MRLLCQSLGDVMLEGRLSANLVQWIHDSIALCFQDLFIEQVSEGEKFGAPTDALPIDIWLQIDENGKTE
jgi:hypothetical protein